MPEEKNKEANETKLKNLKELLSYLNEEYRQAKISEQTYNELKENYEKRIASIEMKLIKGNKEIPEKTAEAKPEAAEEKKEEAAKTAEQEPTAEAKPEKQPKEEPKTAAVEEPPAEEVKEKPKAEEETKTTEAKPKEEKKKLGFLGSIMKNLGSIMKKKPKKEEAEKKEEPKTAAVEEEPKEEQQPEEEAEKKEEQQPEEPKEEQPETAAVEEEPKEEKKKHGFFGSIMKKTQKEEKPPEEKKEEELSEEEKLLQEAASYVTPEGRPTGLEGGEAEEPKEENPAKTDVFMELEKLKVMLDTMRETKKATDETLQNIFESIGEIRNMSFQSDASLRETSAKLEKIEDEISDLKPQKITKKFSELDSELEKHQMQLEKFEMKTMDMADNINKALETLRAIGGIENLAKLNSEIQKKMSDINEVYKYIERLSMKTEKTYSEFNKSINDLILYKTKQDNLDDVMKDLLKSVDAISIKFESYATKKDFETLRKESLVIQNQINELNKALPLIKAKLPEKITTLKNQKEDIQIFLDFIKEQLKSKKIKVGEYEAMKRKNEKKLSEIDEELEIEWETFLSGLRVAQSQLAEKHEEPAEEKKEEPKAAEQEPTAEAKPEEQPKEEPKTAAVEEPPAEEEKEKPKKRRKEKH
ncbi:MAG: hypothetical protein NT129_01735, partial [Candidatus Aenigmarchaeota archaeon]|nr:hypothetical protein [Candidatus Aenigmarchaeota archaeon]